MFVYDAYRAVDNSRRVYIVFQEEGITPPRNPFHIFRKNVLPKVSSIHWPNRVNSATYSSISHREIVYARCEISVIFCSVETAYAAGNTSPRLHLPCTRVLSLSVHVCVREARERHGEATEIHTYGRWGWGKINFRRWR